MSTGKRLAKRSIIGTRVCAPGNDGKYYSGVIHAVKTPASTSTEPGLRITPKTRYSVRFDPVSDGRPPSPTTEYFDRDLIGPGFGSVTSTKLVYGQKVFLTYNGREIHAQVTQHREHLDEVDVIIAPNGQEGTMRLTKRIDEIRLLESRKSARLADQDTDFARLADMAGDRKRASSHSIDVPHVPGSRKRRPSSSNDSYGGWNSLENGSSRIGHACDREGCRTNERGDCMDACTAALVLMSLSNSPRSPHHSLQSSLQSIHWHCDNWRSHGSENIVVGSPGIGTSNSSSSCDASWRSGTPSPPLSEEGGTPNSSGFDEGIVTDYWEEMHPRKKKRELQKKIELNDSNGYNFEKSSSTTMVFICTWPGCCEVRTTCPLIEDHVRQSHLGPKISKRTDEDFDMSDHEEEFYYQEVAVNHMSSPPTMSHRDMARPPHEDPEYQKQLLLEAAITSPSTNELKSNIVIVNATQHPPPLITTPKERPFNFRVSPIRPRSPATPKHSKHSSRQLNHQNMNMLSVTTSGKITSPRRVRGDTKKCRKIYGMENREQWCTQCKWKKACVRFAE